MGCINPVKYAHCLTGLNVWGLCNVVFFFLFIFPLFGKDADCRLALVSSSQTALFVLPFLPLPGGKGISTAGALVAVKVTDRMLHMWNALCCMDGDVQVQIPTKRTRAEWWCVKEH